VAACDEDRQSDRNVEEFLHRLEPSGGGSGALGQIRKTSASLLGW
jgi:hypothetical protein